MSISSKFKNQIIKTFIRLLNLRQKINHFNPQKPKILVVSTTAMGDTLWATPTIKSIKEKYPNSFLAILTSPIGSQILKNNPYIDETLILKKPFLKQFFPLLKTLRKLKIETVLLFHTSQRLTLPLCSLINAEKIIGFEKGHKGLEFLLTEKIKDENIHEIKKRSLLAEKIDVKCKNYKIEFYLTSLERDFVANLLKNQNFGNQPLILIHPGANDPYKCWPKNNFIELGNLLKNFYNGQILISGSLKEDPLVQEIKDKIPGSMQILGWGLREFAALLEKIDLLITNDTGPMHLASSLNTNTVAIFAPTNKELSGPFQILSTLVIDRKPTCTPCLKRKCKIPFCLAQITPKEIFDGIMKHFQIKKAKK
ncbi:MAG: glycosyltransferase family 9 protein [Chlamydiae bacterium]|nr:glycosyltransferase family 9 protein [Chlamydiota bacterium]